MIPQDYETTIRETARLALEKGKITPAEHDYYIEQKLRAHTSNEEKHNAQHNPTLSKEHEHALIGAMLLIIFSFMAFAVFTANAGITGYVTFDELYTSYDDTLNITINASNLQSFKISGALDYGMFVANLYVGTQKLLVYEEEIIVPKITTQFKSYARGEAIALEINASEYTLWLNDAFGNTTPINETLSIEIPGEYRVDAILNESGNITKESIGFIVREDNDTSQNIPRTTNQKTFTNKCIETCTLNTGNSTLTLEILTTGNFTLTDVGVEQNSAPTQIAQIPNIVVNGTTTIELSTYFTDANNDTLIYEMNNIVGVEENVVGSTLTLSSSIPGNYVATLYVSDLTELLQTTFNITVLAQEVVEENTTQEIEQTNTSFLENSTQNSTVQNTQNTSATIIQNTTINASLTNTTITQTTSAIIDCNYPDINLRPTYCFSEVMTDAFDEIVAPLKNKDQLRVGRITRFGNIIISGMVIENSANTPSSRDFALGYTQTRNFANSFVPTAWIDSQTGDLHLIGQLYEEQKSMAPPQYNSFISVNENGIVLSYFDEITGDLYLRGNIVQLGKP